jgi:hypothetical protein
MPLPQHAIGQTIVALAWLAAMPPDVGRAANQANVELADLDEVPVGNEQFADVTVHSRITHRFEIYNPHSPEQLRAIKEMGFTQVILDWPNLHAAASELGLDVVLAHWWTLKTEVKEIERAVDYARQVDPRRLAGFSMMDEPERYSPETKFIFYRSLYRDLRAYFDKELPRVKLEISHWGPLASWTPSRYRSFIPLYEATDRIRIMPYPDLDEGPLSEVYWQILRSRRIMQLAGRDLPQVVILQTWVLPENPQLPTIDELRVMAYSAMLAGAETLSFYNYDPQQWAKTPGFTAGFTGLMQELTEFSRQHGGQEVESRMSPQGVLTARILPPHGRPVTVVINTNRDTVDGLAALAVTVEVDGPAADARPCAAGRIGLRAWLSRIRHREVDRPRRPRLTR